MAHLGKGMRAIDSEKQARSPLRSLTNGRLNSGFEKATRRIIANQSSGLRAAFSYSSRANMHLKKHLTTICYSPSFTCGFTIPTFKGGR